MAPSWTGFRPEEISALVNETVLSIHAEEAAFLWLLRDRAVRAPHYSLDDLADLEERVEAHLQGLRVSGEHGWVLCETQVQEGPGEVFAATALALALALEGSSQRFDGLLEIACAKPELTRGFISALGWQPWERVVERVQALACSDRPELRSLALRALVVHRREPGGLLEDLLSARDPALRARALESAGQLGSLALLPRILSATRDEDDECRFWACWSGLVLGDRTPALLDGLRSFAAGESRHVEPGASLLIRCLDPQAADDWLRDLHRAPDGKRLFALCAGCRGDPGYMQLLLELMHDDAVCRVAGEAFRSITGVDLAYADLDRDAPEEAPLGPTEDPADEEVSMDVDEDLPWPDARRVADWWSRRGAEFRAGQRYLVGKPMDAGSLRDVLRVGTQRQRAAAALERCLRAPGLPLFEVRARALRQAAEI